MVCKKDFEKLDIEKFKLKCCKSNLCVECLKIHVYHPFQYLKLKNSSFFCLICRTKFKQDSNFSDILSKSSYECFMKKILQKKKCGNCENYKGKNSVKKLLCKHEICEKCLNLEINKNLLQTKIKCPIKDCEEFIQEKLINEYREKKSSNFKDGISSQNSISEPVSHQKYQQKTDKIIIEVKNEKEKEKNTEKNIIKPESPKKKSILNLPEPDISPQKNGISSQNSNSEPVSQQKYQKKNIFEGENENDEEKKTKKNIIEPEPPINLTPNPDKQIPENCGECEKSELKLDCKHLFCRDCLNIHLIRKIDKKNFFLDCPSLNCFREIPYNTIRKILSHNYFFEYDNFLLKNNGFLPEEMEIKGGKPTFCPNINCVFYMKTVFTCEEASFFPCVGCDKSFCVNKDCGGDYEDHKDRNCEEFKKNIGNWQGINGEI